MANPTWIRKVDPTQSQSHISFYRFLNPIIKTSGFPTSNLIDSKSRKAEQPLSSTYPLIYTIFIPAIVSFSSTATSEGTQLILSSTRGDIRFIIPARFSCQIQERSLSLFCDDLERYSEFRTLLGALYRTLLGVTKGYRVKLKTVGVGYKGRLEESDLLRIVLGYSHPLHYFLDQSTMIKFSRKNNRFNLQGPNSAIIYQTAADLYRFKKPDVYKGKGVRYRGVKLLKKEGKKKK
jgi:large subunit ribosomal protein L6